MRMADSRQAVPMRQGMEQQAKAGQPGKQELCLSMEARHRPAGQTRRKPLYPSRGRTGRKPHKPHE